MLADLDADVADLAADRRGENQPVGAHQLGALLGDRRALGGEDRARSPALERALGDLRLGGLESLALADDPLVERFELRLPSEQGRAAVLDLTLAARTLAGELRRAPHRRLGEGDLSGGDSALALQRADRRRQALPLLLKAAQLGAADVGAEVDLAPELDVLSGELGELAADAAGALGQRQRHKRRSGGHDLSVADVNLAHLGRGGRIDPSDSGVIGDDSAHPGSGGVAAEGEEKDDDRGKGEDEAGIEARGRRNGGNDGRRQPVPAGVDDLHPKKLLVHVLGMRLATRWPLLQERPKGSVKARLTIERSRLRGLDWLSQN